MVRDPDVFAEFYEVHYPAVRRFVAVRVSVDRFDDVVSETFLVAWRRFSLVPRRERAWLFGVALKVLSNDRRGAGRARALRERVRDVAVLQDPGVEAAVDRRELRRAVLTALSALGSADRDLVLLRVWDGLSPREIAVVLELSPVVVRARLSRALRRLQQTLRHELSLDAVPGAKAVSSTSEPARRSI